MITFINNMMMMITFINTTMTMINMMKMIVIDMIRCEKLLQFPVLDLPWTFELRQRQPVGGTISVIALSSSSKNLISIKSTQRGAQYKHKVRRSNRSGHSAVEVASSDSTHTDHRVWRVVPECQFWPILSPKAEEFQNSAKLENVSCWSYQDQPIDLNYVFGIF